MIRQILSEIVDDSCNISDSKPQITQPENNLTLSYIVSETNKTNDCLFNEVGSVSPQSEKEDDSAESESQSNKQLENHLEIINLDESQVQTSQVTNDDIDTFIQKDSNSQDIADITQDTRNETT
jgi:hypothetical protein